MAGSLRPVGSVPYGPEARKCSSRPQSGSHHCNVSAEKSPHDKWDDQMAEMSRDVERLETLSPTLISYSEGLKRRNRAAAIARPADASDKTDTILDSMNEHICTTYASVHRTPEIPAKPTG